MGAAHSRSLRGRLRHLATNDTRIITLEAAVVFVVVWTIVSHQFDLAGEISSPVLVAERTAELLVGMEWVSHVVATARRTLLGFLVTMGVGSVLGLMMGWSDFWRDALKDYIIAGLALPSLFAVVFAAMAFGTSDQTPMVAAAAISFPFVAQGLFQGVNDIDTDLIGMSSAFEVSRARVARRVVIESVMPEWFAGARYAFAICWKITTLAEFLVGTDGIGFMIARQMNQLSLTGVLAWTVLFMVIIMIAEYGVFQQVEKRVFDWRPSDEIAWG